MCLIRYLVEGLTWMKHAPLALQIYIYKLQDKHNHTSTIPYETLDLQNILWSKPNLMRASMTDWDFRNELFLL